MNYSQAYFYDISCLGLAEPEVFEAQARKVINEINQTVGWDGCTKVNLEPLSESKKLFSLSIYTEMNRHPIFVTKQGRKPSSLLSKAKKAVKKKAREIQFRDTKRQRLGHHSGLDFSTYGEAS